MINEHAIERINNRIKSVGIQVNVEHVKSICKRYPKGKHYTRIMLLDNWTMTADGSHGDCITVITYNGNVNTVMLSERNQRWQDGTFHSHEQPRAE